MATDELKISTAEHKSRIEKIQKQLRRRTIDALYLTNSTRILYTTGFAHISTERPLAAVIPNDDPPIFIAPQPEHDHTRHEYPLAREVLTYPHNPGLTHPNRHFFKFMVPKGLASPETGPNYVE